MPIYYHFILEYFPAFLKAIGSLVMYALFGNSKLVLMKREATSAIITAIAVAPLNG
jgi:hypothetical protein